MVAETITDGLYQRMLRGDLMFGSFLSCQPTAPTMDFLALFEMAERAGHYFGIQGQSKEHVPDRRQKRTDKLVAAGAFVVVLPGV